MKDLVIDTMRKAEKLAIKFKKQLNRFDLDYTIQTSISSAEPGEFRYACQLTPPAKDLAPITFIAITPEELLEKMKTQIKSLDYEAVEKGYHVGQIAACNRTIKYHEERLKEMESADEETTTETAD